MHKCHGHELKHLAEVVRGVHDGKMKIKSENGEFRLIAGPEACECVPMDTLSYGAHKLALALQALYDCECVEVLYSGNGKVHSLYLCFTDDVRTRDVHDAAKAIMDESSGGLLGKSSRLHCPHFCMELHTGYAHDRELYDQLMAITGWKTHKRSDLEGHCDGDGIFATHWDPKDISTMEISRNLAIWCGNRSVR